MNVLASASGKASFNLSVHDGKANLQLGFQLGLPGDLHLPHQNRQHVSPKFKGSVRKERDRVRAAEHQAKLRRNSGSDSDLAVPAKESLTSHASPSDASFATTPTIAASATTHTTTAASAAPSVPTSTFSTAVTFSSIAASVKPISAVSTSTSAVPASNTVTSKPPENNPTKSKHPHTVPCQLVCPFCPPEKSYPLKEFPLFLHDLRFKVDVNASKDFKVKHRTTAKSFASKVKENPDVIFKSTNYEETFIDFCEESEKPLYRRIFEHLPI